ncbi:MAG: rhodanese-like domain-containing protein [Bacteroidota bacterium]|nr:rhodanese-like domain-containing protein [Bacteroidota bacterium]
MAHVHPRDHNKISQKLPLIGIAFVVLLIVGFISIKEPERKYTISVEEMHSVLLKGNQAIAPEDAVKLMNSGNQESDRYRIRFVDLRNPHEFINGHIEGAVNIPLQNIFSEEYEEIWNDTSITNIIYANSHDVACGPWMLLKQLGHNNNKILLGGYNFFRDNVPKKPELQSKSYQDEKARYDFAKIVKETAGGLNVSASKSKKGKLPFKRRKGKKSAKGGCS